MAGSDTSSVTSRARKQTLTELDMLEGLEGGGTGRGRTHSHGSKHSMDAGGWSLQQIASDVLERLLCNFAFLQHLGLCVRLYKQYDRRRLM
jgi:hypothetical protein